MREAIPIMRCEPDDPAKFKDIYLFTFNFAKVENQKSLALDTALAFWELLLTDRFPHLSMWLDFLREKHGKAISRDTWNLLLDFVLTANDDFSNHDTDALMFQPHDKHIDE
ncbi:hypothetical protein HK102_001969 [Quaeritorhiza haematococci]|nr:hypothetical protein HK102_001969 [Quaeritorhiza haematococci]